MSLVPTQISCPHFCLRGFFGQVFYGLRLIAFVSVVSGSSALLVFSLFCFPFLILCTCLVFHSCLNVPLLNIFTLDVYEINHLIFLNMFIFYVCLVQLSRDRSLSGEICLA